MIIFLSSLAVGDVAIEGHRPDPANARIVDDELEMLVASLRAWGPVRPVVARRDDAIVVDRRARSGDVGPSR